VDWYSRKILSWRVSNTLDSEFCVEAVVEALKRYDAQEILNTDQGAQFTSRSFIDVLDSDKIQISMGSKGRVHDNIFIERLWWTLNYRYLYLHSFDNGSELRKGFGEGPSHQALDDITPDEVYYDLPQPLAEAA
jgi:putative transposase